MVGSKKLGKTKTEWEGICVALRPFHCVHADDGLDTPVSGLVLVQVTVSVEACQASRIMKTADTSLSRPT